MRPDVNGTVSGAATARELARRTTAVAVGSGKGGVGTSTVAALLASTVAADGHNVLLVDAGQRLGALHHLFGLETTASLSALRGGQRDAGSLVVPVSSHLSLIATSAADRDLSSAERRVLMRRVAELFSSYTLVVVDAGSSADSLLSACRDGASRLLAVSAADRISLIATYALVKLVDEHAPDLRVDVVANRMDQQAADRVHEHLNAAAVRFLHRTVPFGGVIPDDPDFGRALAAGLGADQAALGSSAAAAVRAIGEQLLYDEVAPAASLAGVSPPPFLRLLRKG
jgi:MinD-like ATPase involved in chromosome partitioning or flagellar assembly